MASAGFVASSSAFLCSSVIGSTPGSRFLRDRDQLSQHLHASARCRLSDKSGMLNCQPSAASGEDLGWPKTHPPSFQYGQPPSQMFQPILALCEANQQPRQLFGRGVLVKLEHHDTLIERRRIVASCGYPQNQNHGSAARAVCSSRIRQSCRPAHRASQRHGHPWPHTRVA